MQEASLHRRALGAELEGPLSNNLSTLLEIQAEQSRVVDSRLAEMQEQQRECERLLEGQAEGKPQGGQVGFHISNSFHIRESDGGESGRASDEEDVWEDAPHDDLEVHV